MNTTPSEVIINNTISELEKRRAELRAEVTRLNKALRHLRRASAPTVAVSERRNLDALNALFASNGNAWMLVADILSALPQCDRRSLRTGISGYARLGHLEKRPFTVPADAAQRWAGTLPKVEYRLARPRTT